MSPEAGRQVHKWMMLFWATNFIWVWFLTPSARIPYLMVVSIYANFVGHWSGWSAERPTEVAE